MVEEGHTRREEKDGKKGKGKEVESKEEECGQKKVEEDWEGGIIRVKGNRRLV